MVVGFPSAYGTPTVLVLFPDLLSWTTQQCPNLVNRGEHRVTHVAKAGYRPGAGLVVARATRVLDDDRDVAEIGALPNRRLDADFSRHADDEERANAAIAERG